MEPASKRRNYDALGDRRPASASSVRAMLRRLYGQSESGCISCLGALAERLIGMHEFTRTVHVERGFCALSAEHYSWAARARAMSFHDNWKEDIWCVRGVDMWLTRKIPATIQGKGLGKVPHKVKRAVKAAHGGLEHSSWDTFLQTLWLAGATPPALVSAWKWQGQDARTSMKNVARTWQTPARSAGGPTSCNGTISLIRVCVTLCAMVRYL